MKKNNVLVIAAHPDDELLGAAGTIARHVSQGDSVSCVILGEGALSRDGASKNEVDALHTCALAASKILGISEIHFEKFPDNAFDTVSMLELAKAVETAIRRSKPSVVYTHHASDVNIDHRRTFEAVLTACRPCNESAPRELYSFETLSSTEWQRKTAGEVFLPNKYVDISDTLEKKLDALKCYATEMRPYPHSRSFEGVRILAQYRGLEAGLAFAEAFELIRHVAGRNE